MDKTTFNKVVKSLSSEIATIRKLAFHLHDVEVNQKYGDKLPYSIHLGGVIMMTMKYMPSIIEKEEDILPVVFGAAFHDSMEDARLTYNDVTKIAKSLGLNDEQAYMGAEIVYALTNEKGRNRAERANDKYYQGIRETPYAPLVKMADRIANMTFSEVDEQTQMFEMYKEEYPHFIKSIEGKEKRMKLPKSMKNYYE